MPRLRWLSAGLFALASACGPAYEAYPTPAPIPAADKPAGPPSMTFREVQRAACKSTKDADRALFLRKRHRRDGAPLGPGGEDFVLEDSSNERIPYNEKVPVAKEHPTHIAVVLESDDIRYTAWAPREHLATFVATPTWAKPLDGGEGNPFVWVPPRIEVRLDKSGTATKVLLERDGIRTVLGTVPAASTTQVLTNKPGKAPQPPATTGGQVVWVQPDMHDINSRPSRDAEFFSWLTPRKLDMLKVRRFESKNGFTLIGRTGTTTAFRGWIDSTVIAETSDDVTFGAFGMGRGGGGTGWGTLGAAGGPVTVVPVETLVSLKPDGTRIIGRTTRELRMHGESTNLWTPWGALQVYPVRKNGEFARCASTP